MAFEGASAFLLGAVLDRYFARHVSINSFTETVLRSESRGEIRLKSANPAKYEVMGRFINEGAV